MTITDLSLLDYEIMEVVSKHLDELELLHQDFTLIWVTKLSSKLVAPYNSGSHAAPKSSKIDKTLFAYQKQSGNPENKMVVTTEQGEDLFLLTTALKTTSPTFPCMPSQMRVDQELPHEPKYRH